MIRRLLLCSGVHGSRDSLTWLRRAVRQRRPDALLFAGGILSLSRADGDDGYPWRLTLEDGKFIKEFFAALGELRVFTAIIPAPFGEPLDEFLRLALQAELAFPKVHVVHATLIEKDGLAVCGLGGILAEHELLGLDSLSRPTAEYFLRSLWTARQPRKAILLPTPPPGKLGGVEGEPLVADLLGSLHPDLGVVAGSSARRGSETVGRTLVVNPGCLADGSAAWLDWSVKGRQKVEFLDLDRAGRRPFAQEEIGPAQRC
jgi:hypothetical protein